MKGLTGVSLPVARHGGIVSKLLNHGSRALPARGQEERGQRPEGLGPPWGPQRAHASPGARRPGRGPALQHRLGRSLPDLGRENSLDPRENNLGRPFPSSQSEWASGSTVGVNPASHTAPRAQPHPHGAHSIFSPSSPSLSTGLLEREAASPLPDATVTLSSSVSLDLSRCLNSCPNQTLLAEPLIHTDSGLNKASSGCRGLF